MVNLIGEKRASMKEPEKDLRLVYWMVIDLKALKGFEWKFEILGTFDTSIPVIHWLLLLLC